MAKINLPSILTKETWFYEDKLEPFLGKPYISYSTVTSYFDYLGDFVKSKLIGIREPGGIYADFGVWCGKMLETGEIPKENPHGFEGAENFDFSERHEGAEYERSIVIDRGDYFIIGFIDRFKEYEDGCEVTDQKTGGKGKEETYKSDDYIQTVLYAHALELEGKKIKATNVWFLRREGSHYKPPLRLSKEQFYIPIAYNKARVKFALDKVDKAVKGITELKNTYDKIFG